MEDFTHTQASDAQPTNAGSPREAGHTKDRRPFTPNPPPPTPVGSRTLLRPADRCRSGYTRARKTGEEEPRAQAPTVPSGDACRGSEGEGEAQDSAGGRVKPGAAGLDRPPEGPPKGPEAVKSALLHTLPAAQASAGTPTLASPPVPPLRSRARSPSTSPRERDRLSPPQDLNTH